MTYVLPDEPRGAIRPDLAVAPLWPLLTLMIVGPMAGFAWLAFNSWALGSRHAVRHTIIAAAMVPLLGISTIVIAASAKVFLVPVIPDYAILATRLMLISLQALALVLAFWVMWDQSDAEEWRNTFGQPLSNGAKPFVVLLIARLFLGGYLPVWVQVFAFWAAS